MALLVLVWASTTPTLGAWTSGVLRNPDSTTAAASVAFAVAGCARGPRVSGSGDCAGTLQGSQSVVNDGTARADQLTASVSGESCGPVQAANRVRTANPLLPRSGARLAQPGPFAGSTAMTLDGTGYAAAVIQQTSTSVNGGTYGYGIWFKAAPGQGGTLFGFDGSATTGVTGGSDDRQLVLGTDGRLTFTSLQLLGLLQPGPASTTVTFNDNQWHFAYVTMNSGGLTLTNSIYVDGVLRGQSAATSVLGLLSYSTSTGYWHVGWGPLTPAYFTGSLSNLVVFANGNAPAAPATNPATQNAMDTFSANASEHWRLDDTGATTYTGPHPVIGVTSPCTLATLTWTFGGTTVVNAVLAATFTTSTWTVPAVPGPGAAQASNLTIARTAGANAYVVGLRLLVPATYTVRVTASWSLGFRFAAAESALVIPP